MQIFALLEDDDKCTSSITMANAPKKIVIVGGGFGGLAAAKILAQSKADIEVTIIDQHNYHLFQPLLYQVAMAGLSPGEIAVPIRTVLSGYRKARSLLGKVLAVDRTNKLVKTDFGELPYDYLILSCGSQHSYFGHENWEPFAPGLKSLEQATEVRRRVLSSFEAAERTTDPEEERKLLTFVVVGGGPTGVELAGSLGEISRFTLRKDFRHIDPRRTRVILIEAGPRLLAAFDESLSESAKTELESLGVTVWTNMRVTEINSDGVRLGNEFVRAATVIWAAGVKPSELNAGLGAELDRIGRVMVSPDLSLPGQPDVFVIGDQAHFAHTKDHKPLPGLAPVAMQQGRHVAKVILNDLKGKAREPFEYFDKGQMATIGRRKAVVEVGKIKFTGFFAWITWLVVHIFYLISFRNRLIVLLQWSWSYFTYRRGAQLILSKDWRSFTDGESRAK